VVIELDVPGLPPHGLGIEVGQDQTGIPPVRQTHILGSQDREREVAVPADELVFLRIAVRERRLDQRPREESDLACSESIVWSRRSACRIRLVGRRPEASTVVG
jgi:hypothetical protein